MLIGGFNQSEMHDIANVMSMSDHHSMQRIEKECTLYIVLNHQPASCLSNSTDLYKNS